MRFSKKLEGVLGILKARFRFLKTAFNLLRRQDSIDNAIVTCCILHNIMMLRHGGYLAENLTPYPGGLEEALAIQHGGIRWNGTERMWVRDGSDQQELAATTYKNQPPATGAYSVPSRAYRRSGDEETSRAVGASDECSC